ncbi:hypothetical protein Lal_00042870 [Lupinus albus]|nr:hypothetical protein Lal_00042870 [Lupinus albus]
MCLRVSILKFQRRRGSSSVYTSLPRQGESNLAQARIFQYLPVFHSPSEPSLAQARPSRSSENLAVCPILQDCYHFLRKINSGCYKKRLGGICRQCGRRDARVVVLEVPHHARAIRDVCAKRLMQASSCGDPINKLWRESYIPNNPKSQTPTFIPQSSLYVFSATPSSILSSLPLSSLQDYHSLPSLGTFLVVTRVDSNETTNEPDIVREDRLNKEEASRLDNKRKSASEFDVHDSIVGNEGNQKSSRQRSWTWDHFIKCNDSFKPRAKSMKHRNGAKNLNNHLLTQCKKIPKDHIDISQKIIYLQPLKKEDDKGIGSTLVGVGFDADECRKALARIIIVLLLVLVLMRMHMIFLLKIRSIQVDCKHPCPRVTVQLNALPLSSSTSKNVNPDQASATPPLVECPSEEQ